MFEILFKKSKFLPRQLGTKALRMVQLDHMSSRRFLFEFMDEPWVPASLRHTLTETLHFLNTHCRLYTNWMLEGVIRYTHQSGIQQVVELGAGAAPITKGLAKHPSSKNLKLICCDLHPNITAFRELENLYPGLVQPLYESVDFSAALPLFTQSSLLVLSSTFHHLPFEKRKRVLETLLSQGHSVVIAEPLKRSLWSLLFTMLGIFPAFLSPIFHCRRGFFYQVLWTWLIPVAPFLLAFDGFVSCHRMWTEKEWDGALTECSPPQSQFQVESSFFALRAWVRQRI